MDTHLPGSGPISVSAGAGRRGVRSSGAFEPGYAGRLSRFEKRADLVVHEEEPFNAETGPAALAEGSLTEIGRAHV